MIDFQKNIQDSIEERQHVLFEIERVLFTRRYNLSQKHLEIFSIQSISIIYSIWEGFIQEIFRLYVDEINSKRISFSDLSDSIVIHHMENTFKQLNEYPQRNAKKIAYFNQLNEFYTLNIKDISRIIKTDSNVSFSVLNNLLQTFSLDPFPEIWENYKPPKPDLKNTMQTFLRYRNSVSHGGDISSEEKVTHEVFKKYKNLVIDLMFGIQERMIQGLENKTYLK